MSEDKNAKDESKTSFIIWDRTKRPLIFVVVCLLAAFALNSLYKSKTGYDDNRNASYEIVDNTEESKSPKRIEARKLVDLIAKPLANEAAAATVQGSIAEIKFQPFKTDDELTKALTEVLVKNKNSDLKDSQTRLENTQNEINDLRDQKARALEELERKTSGKKDVEPVYLDYLVLPISLTAVSGSNSSKNQTAATVPPDIYLARALSDELKTILKKPSYLKQDLVSIVSNYDTENINILKANLERHKRSIKNIADNYELIIKNVYKIKGNLAAAFFTDEKKAENENFGNEKSTLAYFFLDDRGSFNVLYKLVEVTLTVVLVFGLLYIIVIPLRYIFFLSTSADILADKAKSYLERKENPASPPSGLGQAILLTAGTIGIGAAVVANTTLHSFAAGNKSADDDLPGAIRKLNNLADNIKPGFNPKNNNPANNYQTPADNLTATVNSLNALIIQLQTKIDGLPIEELAKFSKVVEDINKNLISINNAIGTEKFINSPSPQNIFDKLDESTRALNNRNDDVFRQIDLVDKKIVNPNDPKQNTVFNQMQEITNILNDPKNSNSILFKLTAVSNTLGADDFAKSLTAQPQRQNIFLALNKVGDDIGGRNDYQINGTASTSLFGKVNYVSNSIGAKDYVESKSTIFDALGTKNDDVINFGSRTVYSFSKLISTNTKDVSDIGRYVVKDSGNIETFFKRLFSGRQYLINPFLITQLKSRFKSGGKSLLPLNPNDEQEVKQIAEKNLEIMKDNDEIKQANDNLQILIEVLEKFLDESGGKNKTLSEKDLRGKLVQKLLDKTGRTKEDVEKNILNPWWDRILLYSSVASY